MQVQTSYMILYLAAVWAAGYGACLDFKYHKIYNKLTLPMTFAGLLVQLILDGFGGLLNSFLGIILGASYGILWILGMLKAGDVKLYMAVGAVTGWRFCGYTMIFSVLIGGIVATCLMVARRDGTAAFRRLKEYFLHMFYTKKLETYEPESESAYFSFGCCIFAGAAAALWYVWLGN